MSVTERSFRGKGNAFAPPSPVTCNPFLNGQRAQFSGGALSRAGLKIGADH
jgi:hypothetical protein